MKKNIKFVISLIFFGLLFMFNSFAEERIGIDYKSQLLPSGVHFSIQQKIDPRGRYIASSGLSITNKGYGVLEVYADTLAYEAVKKIKMTIYLDQWNEDENDWVQIDSKSMTYEYDGGDEDLHEVSESFLVENLETEKYYRLRGLHAVWSFDGFMESHATMTDGVLLTSGPT
ncbi:MAG TPA: hypothetical protein IAA51_07305 [Candidatus Cottocaccamicrobium excrementipullorum]|nr:hypothetical protein [Candidatus Cottocaccamicrobium excrementipullorum]